jgi:hypothetical protein
MNRSTQRADHTMAEVTAVEVPPDSEIAGALPGAYFHDCYEVRVDTEGVSALALYLAFVARTPDWVNALMNVRNRVVALCGLKNLGQLGEVPRSKPATAYRVGDRVGIFTLLYLSEHEIVLGDSDLHLDVKVAVCKLARSDHGAIVLASVVHVHNAWGKVYMAFVAPIHKIIVRTMLARAPRAMATPRH